MKSRCVPLELTNHILAKYPKALEQAKMFRQAKASGEIPWSDLCYLPIGATLAMASGGIPIRQDNALERFDCAGDAQILAAILPWRIYKQIYSFPQEMEDLLFDQADEDCLIPVDIIKNMPYPCIYISLNDNKDKRDGFFFWIEEDQHDKRLEMRFLIVRDNLTTLPYALHVIPGGNIQDGIDAYYKEVKRQMRLNPAIERSILKVTEIEGLDTVKKYIQLVMYICAENKQITEDTVQRKIYRKPKSEEYIKDKPREVQKWDLGLDMAAKVRKLRGTSKRYIYGDSSRSSGTGTAKAPHIRKAHWHHYWAGKHGSEERKLILKWLPPTFVNVDNEEELEQVTINKVDERKSRYDA